jgi:hypothetical protein
MRAHALLPVLCMLVFAAPMSGKPARGAEANLSLGRPVQDGPIAVVPILANVPFSMEKYITLAEATRRGLVEIVEIPGREEVNALEVRNRAELPLMLFAGELLLGGKQDRIVAKDIILPPHDSRRVPVFCVEHGRWDNHKMSFEGADTFVPDSLRKVATETRSQSRVWERVAEVNAAARAAPSTGTVRAMLRAPQVQRRVSRTTTKLHTAFTGDRRVVGVICWLNGRIHSADLFANPAMFAASRDKVLRGYAADVELGAPRISPVDMKACQRFLNDIVRSRRTLSERSRYDTQYDIRGNGISGYESGSQSFRGTSASPATKDGFLHGNYRPEGR